MKYEIYRFSMRELFIYIVAFTGCMGGVSFLFFDSYRAFFILILLFPVFLTDQKKRLLERKKDELKTQFCVMIDIIAASISAGISVENAFRECSFEMNKMYGSDSAIAMELKEIIRKMDINITLTEALTDFSETIGIGDISDFITVFTTATKSGGNLQEIISNTVSIMQEKRRVEEEINAMLKGKMLEQKVICVVPFLLFLYLRISSKEFVGVLYHNLSGVIVMSICLIIYIASIKMSEKIVNIKV